MEFTRRGAAHLTGHNFQAGIAWPVFCEWQGGSDRQDGQGELGELGGLGGLREHSGLVSGLCDFELKIRVVIW